ncbi:ribonuclease Y [Desulfobacca acetoxidans]|uniref:ribonuclease Y n=1 Tax=Desulfobacca acetoxidans TaxID=60893 RepID=UPI00059C81D6
MPVESISFLAVGLSGGLGVLAGFYLRRMIIESRIDSVENLAKKILDEARKEAETIKKEEALRAKDQLFQMKVEFDKESKERRSELNILEKRLLQKEEHLEKKISILDSKESEINNRQKLIDATEKTLKEKEIQYQNLIQEQRHNLERLAGMSSEEGRNLLLKTLEREVRTDAARLVKRIETDAREVADKKAKEIIGLAIKRYASEYVAEQTVSVVNLPNEEMKGRIIGREGRNIRALEAATGVDVIIDDTPEAVILSAFNPIRREIARRSLEHLITDGRIHPARIEEVVEKIGQEVEANIREAGEEAAFDAGVHGLHPELIKLLGKLRYRTSFAQNVLQHSIEVSYLCGIMAAELGLNAKHAKRAGLLHDIGKAVDHEVEGPHAMIGAELAKRFGESVKVIHAIQAHHEDVPPESVLAVLVQAADTLSGARPGARREMLETYVRRLEELERIARNFNGVNKTYAIQAGREIRLIVDSDKVSDEEAFLLCREAAKKIETELTYPGQVKVTVIRETRAVEYAR